MTWYWTICLLFSDFLVFVLFLINTASHLVPQPAHEYGAVGAQHTYWVSTILLSWEPICMYIYICNAVYIYICNDIYIYMCNDIYIYLQWVKECAHHKNVWENAAPYSAKRGSDLCRCHPLVISSGCVDINRFYQSIYPAAGPYHNM